ncbi:MAG: ABC transporter permease subunit [Deltaproteobacteria bacterium]
MTVAAEIGLTLARELRRNLRSAKGLVSALLFMLGGAGTLLVYSSVTHELATVGGDIPAGAGDEVRRRALEALYHDPATVQHLLGAPPLLLFLHTATLFFLPVLCMLIGYDTLAGELQHRTLRFATVRAHRESLVTGKFLGVWVAAGIMTLALDMMAWAITISRGEASPATTVAYGLQLWLATMVFSAAFVGLTTFVSGLFRSPVLALLTTLAAAFFWWLLRHIVGMATLAPSVGWLANITPGEWEPRLLSPDVLRSGGAAAALVALGLAGLAGACVVLRRRDV